MSDDIVARLRADCAKLEAAHGQNMREIDRLRTELAKERERADAHYRVLECVSAERDALRARAEGYACERNCYRAEWSKALNELSAERESAETYKRTYMELHRRCCGAVAARDELRELLREAREYVADMPIVGDELLARIDAALKGE